MIIVCCKQIWYSLVSLSMIWSMSYFNESFSSWVRPNWSVPIPIPMTVLEAVPRSNFCYLNLQFLGAEKAEKVGAIEMNFDKNVTLFRLSLMDVDQMLESFQIRYKPDISWIRISTTRHTSKITLTNIKIKQVNVMLGRERHQEFAIVCVPEGWQGWRWLCTRSSSIWFFFP